jgi:energy-coupling factor transporter ATP-binding protein EcfA2/energy-coupling factor transporter transmembrane protein EcfT
VLLTGPSGAGKSTLLKALAGVLATTEVGQLCGSVLVDGVDPQSNSAVSLLLQEPADAIVAETVLRDVAFGLENQAVDPIRMPLTVHDALTRVGTADLVNRRMDQISGGESQRVALAGAMVMGHRLLLLDEPTSMLDAASADVVRESIVKQVREQGYTVVLVEHELAPWLPHVDCMLVLSADGRLVTQGPVAEVLASHQTELEIMGAWLPEAGVPQPVRYTFDAFAPLMQIPQGFPGAPGQITALVGPSGGGKSTYLSGLLEQLKHSWSRVGWVPQNPERVLEGHERNVSGGELRRVALQLALVKQPGILLLDEPTTGQDRFTWAALVGSIIAARDAGAAVIVATHDADLIALADRIVDVTSIEDAGAQSYVLTRPVRSLSPLAVLGAAALLLVGSFAATSLSAALAGVTAVLLTLGLMATRAPFRWGMLIPGFIAVASIGFSTWLLNSAHSFEMATTAGLRVAFFVIPGVLLASLIRPSDLGDHLAQRLHVPDNAVVAAVAAFQQFGRLKSVWRDVSMAQYLRTSTPPRFALRSRRVVIAVISEAFSVAARMSVAMEARGFRPHLQYQPRRTWMIPAHWRMSDTAFISLWVIVAIVPLVVRFVS